MTSQPSTTISGSSQFFSSSSSSCSETVANDSRRDDGTSNQGPRPLVIVLAGPTGVGKSAVAAQLCRPEVASRWGARVGHVVSADSVQAYQGVAIGANKPTREEMEQTPHHLIDILTAAVRTYSSAEWMRDALYVIRNLSSFTSKAAADDDDNGDAVTNPYFSQRRELIDCGLAAARARTVGDSCSEPILPVVVGGTMMYLEWLVHGRPDAMKPTEEAAHRAHTIVQSFLDQVANDDEETEEERERRQLAVWQDAVQYASLLGPVFAQRVTTFASNDWYRLRRTLEIAFTVLGDGAADSPSDNNNTQTDVEALFTGERCGGLDTLGDEFDVRCFFLCPDDRMAHTRVVDQRCEEMLLRGLLSETALLYKEGQLPLDGQTARAIGYRQALDYLLDRHPSQQPAGLEALVHDFQTATRRYAKKQMQWFRRDPAFLFVPVQMAAPPERRVAQAVAEVVRLCSLPPTDLATVAQPLSQRTKQENEEQGKGMKFYAPQPHRLVQGTDEYERLLKEADECRALVQKVVLETSSSSTATRTTMDTPVSRDD